MIKNIYYENKPNKISQLNITPNTKKQKLSTLMKKNNSFSRIKKYKSNYENSIIEEQKKIYTINIQLHSDCKNEINKNKNLKNFKRNKKTK